MARRQMVTRSVEIKHAVALYMNDSDYTAVQETLTIPSAVTSEKGAVRFCAENAPEGCTFVKVLEMTVDTKLYGMYLDDFMAQAHELTDERKIAEKE